jgi:hypothetical protein
MFSASTHKNTPSAVESNSGSMHVIERTRQTSAHVVPTKSKFVGREHRSTLLDVWRSRRASLTQLVRRNKGLGLRDIESAILDEWEERERRAVRLEQQRAVLTMPQRHDGDTGPLCGPGVAVTHRGFGGGMLSAIGLRKAA